MKKGVFLAAAAMLACLPAGAAADAALVIDRGPDGAPLFDPALINVRSGKNYLVQFSLAQKTELTGMEIWAAYGGTVDPPGSVTIEIKVRADDGNAPAATNLYERLGGIDSVIHDADYGIAIIGTDFAPITLDAGTYWIGMSGAGTNPGWASFDKGILAPADQRLLAGDTLVSTPPQVFSLAYRLTGNVLAGPVPEPASWALMIAGFGLAGTALRRRARASTAYG